MKAPVMRTEIINGYLVVRHEDGRIICEGRIVSQERVKDIQFSDVEYRKNNKTRQAAMRAMQAAGYK